MEQGKQEQGKQGKKMTHINFFLPCHKDYT